MELWSDNNVLHVTIVQETHLLKSLATRVVDLAYYYHIGISLS